MSNIFLYSLLLLISSCDMDTGHSQLNRYSFGHVPTQKAISISAGGVHACALLDNNQVQCWGDDQDHQCEPRYAKNALITIDATNAKFSKISAGDFFTCGILQDDPHKGIPVCFGKNEEWLNVPNEPVKDIAAGPIFTCVIKGDDTLACVGIPTQIFIKNAGDKIIKPNQFVYHGIDPFSKKDNQDFSNMKFTNIKAGLGRICGTNTKDGIVYCMGSNLRGAGETPGVKLLDYAIDETKTHLIRHDGTLLSYTFAKIKNIGDPAALIYKKIASSLDLITGVGNFYDDGVPIPENMLILQNRSIKDVLDSVVYESSRAIGRYRKLCVLKIDHTIECENL